MKNKHLTEKERQLIYEGLNCGKTFKEIGNRTGKDPSTISKEVKKHLTLRPTSVKRFDDGGNPIPPPLCTLLLKPPYCCNGCRKKFSCRAFDHYYYDYTKAHSDYRKTLSKSREGVALNRQILWDANDIVSNGIKKGQHLYHILQTNDIGYSKSSVYRHLKKGYLTCQPIDFPRVVRFRPRQKDKPVSVPNAVRKGRTYEDFLQYIQENNITNWVEIDTVIGSVGGKCIMTLNFNFCNFMTGILLPDRKAVSAAYAIRSLKRKLYEKGHSFGALIPLGLTDNGGEFSNVAAFEADLNGEQEMRLFFCDPGKAWQKPRVEKSHTLFRDIVPKGESFDDFTQNTVDLIFSNVNSVCRRVLNGKTPYDVFTFIYGRDVASLLGIKYIRPEDVIQSPLLLK